MAKGGYEIYEVYLVKHKKEIEAANPIICELMPLSNYSRKLVRARISQSPEGLPDGEPLWIREDDGHLQDQPWAVKIVEELDAEEVDFDPELGGAEEYGWKRSESR